jgi:hypothetical protein
MAVVVGSLSCRIFFDLKERRDLHPAASAPRVAPWARANMRHCHEPNQIIVMKKKLLEHQKVCSKNHARNKKKKDSTTCLTVRRG